MVGRAFRFDAGQARYRSALARAILEGPILKTGEHRGHVQALAWPIWRKPAPALEPWPWQVAWPYRPYVRPGEPWPRWAELAHHLARVVATSFWAAYCPTCLGHRYGAAWTRWRHVELAAVRAAAMDKYADGWPPMVPAYDSADAIADDELVVQLQEIPTRDAYLQLVQGPPSPCPECGHVDKRAVARWRRHVARHR